MSYSAKYVNDGRRRAHERDIVKGGLSFPLLLITITLILIGVVIAAVRSTYDKNKESMKKRGGIGYLLISLCNIVCKLYLTVCVGLTYAFSYLGIT
mgnify:CR=1 FL=1